jgi:hypothetical protein
MHWPRDVSVLSLRTSPILHSPSHSIPYALSNFQLNHTHAGRYGKQMERNVRWRDRCKGGRCEETGRDKGRNRREAFDTRLPVPSPTFPSPSLSLQLFPSLSLPPSPSLLSLSLPLPLPNPPSPSPSPSLSVPPYSLPPSLLPSLPPSLSFSLSVPPYHCLPHSPLVEPVHECWSTLHGCLSTLRLVAPVHRPVHDGVHVVSVDYTTTTSVSVVLLVHDDDRCEVCARRRRPVWGPTMAPFLLASSCACRLYEYDIDRCTTTASVSIDSTTTTSFRRPV